MKEGGIVSKMSFFFSKSASKKFGELSSSSAYHPSNFRSPPQRLHQHRFTYANRVSFISVGDPLRLYGDDQGTCAFLIGG